MIKLQNTQLDEIDFASQGNAILGIRDSGKTYTATYFAERLIDAKIPFVAFDPIGVWRYLRVGTDGHEGYKVVVAGDDADLPLTPETAPNIVRAAMRENIPLVLDLYSMSLTKRHLWRSSARPHPSTGSSGMWEAIKQRMTEAGVDKHLVRLHDFRHYFVTTTYLATGDLKLSQELARHESIATTNRYAHFGAEADKAYDRIFNHPAGDQS